jgi:hypothetical protein
MPEPKEDILRRIDLATEPGKMSQQVALDWLEELGADLEARIEALREEMEDA